MADVVKQRRNPRSDSIVGIDLVAVTEPIENARHQMRRTETVGKARVLRALVRVQSQSQLFDSPQTLKLRRVDQPNYQPALGVIAQRNDVVDRVAVDPLRQFLGPVIEEFGRGSLTQRVAQRDAGLRESLISDFQLFDVKTKNSDREVRGYSKILAPRHRSSGIIIA